MLLLLFVFVDVAFVVCFASCFAIVANCSVVAAVSAICFATAAISVVYFAAAAVIAGENGCCHQYDQIGSDRIIHEQEETVGTPDTKRFIFLLVHSAGSSPCGTCSWMHIHICSSEIRAQPIELRGGPQTKQKSTSLIRSFTSIISSSQLICMQALHCMEVALLWN
jgi:hypothetical protein